MSRIVTTCPKCDAKFAAGRELAGKQIRCPKCREVILMPMPSQRNVDAPPASGTMGWMVVAGTKKSGPFEKKRLRTFVEGGKIPGESFVRDDAEATDWQEVQTIDWLFDNSHRQSVRYCPECDSRVIVAEASANKPRRCPSCAAPVILVNFLDFNGNDNLNQVPAEPWGHFDFLVVIAALIAFTAGGFGVLSLLWNPSLAVLIGFIFLVAGGALFGVTFHHRSQSNRYRVHLPKVENELNSRTERLLRTLGELNALKRNLAKVRDDLVEATEAGFRQQRVELADQLATARDSGNAVHRMAERFLDETRKWWTSRLNGENFQATKDRITKAIQFCRKNGYPVSTKHEHELMKQLKADYEMVLRREHEKFEQKRIREQMREEQRVERELKREMERIDTEKRIIERALAEALQTVGAEHSAEVDALREKLREAEERGQRTKAQAELTKVGHVYVISNIGSFGENVYKVGLTRRLEPMDRVKELGDASVPFGFDVHMMIFSEDAPKLEYTLHQTLHNHRVNRVNFRKEFFRVDLEVIRAAVEQHHGVVEYVADAAALQYRDSLNISDEDFAFLGRAAESTDLEDEDDDLDGLDENRRSHELEWDGAAEADGVAGRV